MKNWYIVKTNWPEINKACQKLLIKEYLGLGGSIWPLDIIKDSEALNLHNNLEAARQYVPIRNGDIYVISNISDAEIYCNAAKKEGLDAILLEVSLAEDNPESDGFDFGNAEGGYSIIESEILMKGDTRLVDEFLSKQTGLFTSIEAMNIFLSKLHCSEDLDSYISVSIKNLDF